MAKRDGMAAERRLRLEALLGELEKRGVGAVVLDRRDDLFYFTGYTGSDAVAVFAVKKRRGWLATDPRYTEEATKTAPDAEIVTWRKSFPGHIGSMLRKGRFKRIAYTPSSLSAAFYLGMRGETGDGVEWIDADPEIYRLRAVKSAGEIKAMEKALACAEGAFAASRKRWKIGMTELDVKNDLEWEMSRRGAEDAAFETIVAIGANASLPHAHAGERKIQAGKMLLVDFGARVDRYNSDLTRTLWAGSMPRQWAKRYLDVLDAQLAAIAAIAPGVSGRDVDAVARGILAKRGLGDYFTHGLGHGVGLAVHEAPRLGHANALALEPGNVVTVEPGVYFPGSGGIRTEDMVVVERGGGRVLSSLHKDVETMVF